MPYLSVISSGGGVPLFTRGPGLPPLRLPTVGSLYGTHAFVSRNGAQLISTDTGSATVLWRTFLDRVLFILVDDNAHADERHAETRITQLLHAMVMVVGRQQFESKVEALRRELKASFKLVDGLLTESTYLGCHVHAVDCMVPADPSSLQCALDGFTDAIEANYAFLLIAGRIAVASFGFWELPSEEKVLLPAYIRSLEQASCRDQQVYLPVSSPDVSVRLLTFELCSGVELCVLCNSTTTLDDLLESRVVNEHFYDSLEHLQQASMYSPCNVPPDVVLDKGLAGFLLIDRHFHRSLSSTLPIAPGSPARRKAAKVLDVQATLRSWYKTVVGDRFPFPSKTDHAAGKDDQSADGTGGTQVTESYSIADTHRCYALRKHHYELYTVFYPDVPQLALRGLSHETLDALALRNGAF